MNMIRLAKKNSQRPSQGRMSVAVLGLMLLALPMSNCFAEKPLTDEEYRALIEKPKKKAEDFFVLNRERNYRAFRPVNSFILQVVLHGSAQKLIDRNGMDDYLKLRFINDLKAYNEESDPVSLFVCEIWTVRENYPIALHIKCRATVFNSSEDWSNESLGITEESKVKDTVKTVLSGFVEEFAVFFLKAKGLL